MLVTAAILGLATYIGAKSVMDGRKEERRLRSGHEDAEHGDYYLSTLTKSDHTEGSYLDLYTARDVINKTLRCMPRNSHVGIDIDNFGEHIKRTHYPSGIVTEDIKRFHQRVHYNITRGDDDQSF